jgi:dienelactone hydrolase
VTSAVQIPAGDIVIEGDLTVPDTAAGLVVFAHGSGSSRFSRRNRAVANVLVEGGFATLLLDLLTREEEAADERTGQFRFDIGRLAQRVVAAIDWAGEQPALAALPIGCFGASTGAAAALAPTLLIVGGHDELVIDLNETARRRLRARAQTTIVPGATHLFEEPGALEHVARLALEWCQLYLKTPTSES